MRPFRFTVVAAGVHDARSWRELCVEVEALGYAALYVPDSSTPQLGPLAALAAAATHTTTLRVGMLVANNDLRHPAVLARELATIDVLSDGRLEWGMGAGWYRPDFQSIGLPFDRPPVRVDRLIESVEVMRRVFSGAPVSFRGRHYTVEELVGTPAPVQQPHPPLLIGAAERRLLTFAGRTADIVSVNRSFSTVPFGGRPPRKRPDEAVVDQIAWIRAGAGDRIDDVEISMEVNPPVVVSPRPSGSELTGDALADPRTWVGSPASIAEALQARRERYGVSHWVVYEQYLRDAAPIVAELAGT